MGHGGRRDPSEYRTIIAEVFYDTEVSKNGVRPVPVKDSLFLKA
jgi:hypothetical protein